MTKINRIAAALGLALAFSMPARAQTDALTMYENFLAQHQTAAQALSANPSLYRSPGFMVQHPDVWSYLNQNPVLYQSLAAKAPAYSPDAAAFNLSNYLHYHPDIARTLAANPSIVNDPAYLNQHPDFKGFLQHHPGVRQQLTMRGWNFRGWQQTHPWDQRSQWREADAWSDRDWHEQWQRQQQIFNERREAQLAEENEEREEHEHHDHGKHLGWYKHPGKHHGDENCDNGDADDHWGGGHPGHHKHHDKHHGGNDKNAIQPSLPPVEGALTEGQRASAEVIHSNRAGREKPARLFLTSADAKIVLYETFYRREAPPRIITSNSAYYLIALVRSQISRTLRAPSLVAI